LARWNRRC